MNIFLVDDDAGVCRLIQMEMEDAGHAVVSSNSAQAALGKQLFHTVPIDLLVTDIVLPGLTGIELDQALRAQNPNLYTLFISGYFPDKELNMALSSSRRRAFLQKPFTPDEFLAAVRQLTKS
ncbi:MAG TPA: response regulator [Bryobacteraceae bacterium]|nr:response regulator [Bryobacteraceae bacterium]